MDLARRMYSRDLKIAAMREIEGGRRIGEVARRLEVSPHLLERWRGEWRARGELAFPGIGRRGVSAGLSELQRIAELERKIGQQALELDFFGQALQLMEQVGRAASVPQRAPAPTASSGPGRSGKAG